MKTNANIRPKTSICGPLSIAFPLLGLGVAEGAGFLLHPNISTGTLIIEGYLMMILIGIGCSIAGMIRGEHFSWLPAVGFGFNILLIAIGSML